MIDAIKHLVYVLLGERPMHLIRANALRNSDGEVAHLYETKSGRRFFATGRWGTLRISNK